MKIKRMLTISIMTICCLEMHAGLRVWPGIQTIYQSDGTTLQIIGHGDEDAHYYTTLDGVLVMPKDFSMYIATADANGQLAASQVLAHESSLRTTAERQMVKTQQAESMIEKVMTQGSIKRVMREPLAVDHTLFPHIGKPKAVVILVNFTDTVFSIANPKATFNKYLNKNEYFTWYGDPEMDANYGSIARYFNDMSNGKFIPQFDLVGPVTLPQKSSYYGSSENYTALVNDAMRLSKDSLDFSQYDENNDGYIDLVCIIYAGYSESMNAIHPEFFWPKSGMVYVSDSYNGKYAGRFAAINELNYTPERTVTKKKKTINGTGLFCHEFSHTLGLPDFYASSGSLAYKSINQNMEFWDLMDLGEYENDGYRPCEYTAWERERMGWLTVDTLKDAADITMKPISDGGKAYRIINNQDTTGHEYYMIENIQKSGWNTTAYGHGMLVTHIDYNNYFQMSGTNVNQTVGHPRYHIVAADSMLVPSIYTAYQTTPLSNSNTDTTNIPINKLLLAKYGGQIFTNVKYLYELAGDPFPGVSGVTELTGMAKVYTGGIMNKPITDIKEAADGTITFKFCGGDEKAAINSVTVSSPTSNVYFSLQGIRLQEPPQHGLYICNKKIYMK